MRDALPEIRARGAELIIVGNGRPEHAIDFRESEGITCPLFVDPELHAYRAAGLRRGLLSSVSPRVIGRGIRAFVEGKRQGETQGDPWQQGGVFIITPGHTVPYAYVSQEAGDHPDPSEVLAALDRVRRKSAPAARRPKRSSP